MVAFKGGNNTGGQNVDYYDNPNYDPKKDGKSSTDYIKKSAQQSADWAEQAEEAYVSGVSDNYQAVVESEVQSAYDKSKADKQTSETVSYFRARERERLNPGISRSPQNNPRFSQPASLDDKLAKFGFSFDPEDPDNYYGRMPQAELTNDYFSTDRTIKRDSSRPGVDPGNYTIYEETVKYKKGDPLPNTAAGVNQELQAIKARTRDTAMEFRGMVFDYIEDIRLKTLDYADSEVAEFYNRSDEYSQTMNRQPLSYAELEDKYFPDKESKKAAKAELQKMISFTDEASDITREYSNISDYAETVIRTNMNSMPFPIGIDDGGVSVNDKITAKNYKKNLDAYSKWKSKKGIPKIVRLITKLP